MTRSKFQRSKYRHHSKRYFSLIAVLGMTHILQANEKKEMKYEPALNFNGIELNQLLPKEPLSIDADSFIPTIQETEELLKATLELANLNPHSVFSQTMGINIEDDIQKFANPVESAKNQLPFSFSIVPLEPHLAFVNESEPIIQLQYTPSSEMIEWVKNNPSKSHIKSLIQKVSLRGPYPENQDAFFSFEISPFKNVSSLIKEPKTLVKVFFEAPKIKEHLETPKISKVIFFSDQDENFNDKHYDLVPELILSHEFLDIAIALKLEKIESCKNQVGIEIEKLQNYLSEEPSLEKAQIQPLYSLKELKSNLVFKEVVQPQSFDQVADFHFSKENPEAISQPELEKIRLHIQPYVQGLVKLFNQENLNDDTLALDRNSPKETIEKLSLSVAKIVYELKPGHYQLKMHDLETIEIAKEIHPSKQSTAVPPPFETEEVEIHLNHYLSQAVHTPNLKIQKSLIHFESQDIPEKAALDTELSPHSSDLCMILELKELPFDIYPLPGVNDPSMEEFFEWHIALGETTFKFNLKQKLLSSDLKALTFQLNPLDINLPSIVQTSQSFVTKAISTLSQDEFIKKDLKSILSNTPKVRETEYDIKLLPNDYEPDAEYQRFNLSFAGISNNIHLDYPKTNLKILTFDFESATFDICIDNDGFKSKILISKSGIPISSLEFISVDRTNEIQLDDGEIFLIDFMHAYKFEKIVNVVEATIYQVDQFLKPTLAYQFKPANILIPKIKLGLFQDHLSLISESISLSKYGVKKLAEFDLQKELYQKFLVKNDSSYFEATQTIPLFSKYEIESTTPYQHTICLDVVHELPNILVNTIDYPKLLRDNEEIFDPYAVLDIDKKPAYKQETSFRALLRQKALDYLTLMPSLSDLNTYVLSTEFRHELEVIASPDGESYYFAVKLIPYYPEDLRKLHQNVFFVLDPSRSISEERFDAFKKGILRSIPYLSQDATFNIIVLNRHFDILNHHCLSNDKQSLELAKIFLENIGYGFTISPQDFSKVIPFIENKFKVSSSDINTIIILSDGTAYKQYHVNKDKIADICLQNKNLFQIYTVASSQENYLGALDMIAFHNHGELIYSKTNAALPRQLAILIKNLRTPLANNLHVSTIRNESDTVEFFPPSGYMPALFADQPLVIYGKTDRLQNIDLMVQGKVEDEWINITQSINLRQAKRGDRELLRNCQMMEKKLRYFTEIVEPDET